MDYITTTNLRTQSSKLVDDLKKGRSVSLVHRSKIVGVIKPAFLTAGQINLGNLRKFLARVKPEKLIPQQQRESVYRQNLLEKHGKDIP